MPPRRSKRQDVIADSIIYCVHHHDNNSNKPRFLARLPAYFYVHWLNLACVRAEVFQDLRALWRIDEQHYEKSFAAEGDGDERALQPLGDMGYSGSTFFQTSDEAYLVKSVPRRFEHSFFKKDLLQPYAAYLHNNPESLLVRIADFLENTQCSLGSILGLAPSHHIIMENILHGKKEAETEWEPYDLKPMSYFYPERDIAEGVLTSEATKSRLADDFDDKLVLTLDQAEEFKAQLQKDTALLESCNAVDYSLFLVRIPQSTFADPSPASSKRESWRGGVRSADGKYLYRAVILDFFWAKHKVHAIAMTGLIKAYNLVDRKGHMSVTTSPGEYRHRWLKMVTDMIKVQAGDSP